MGAQVSVQVVPNMEALPCLPNKALPVVIGMGQKLACSTYVRNVLLTVTERFFLNKGSKFEKKTISKVLTAQLVFATSF